jgi:predicted GNAT superfamily acetyltransferase
MTSRSESSREAAPERAPEAAGRSPARIRPARESDFQHELRLNAEFVQLLSPLDLSGLRRLDRLAAAHRVVEIEGKLAAFVLALRERSDYASPNYRWFAERFRRFLYVDRVVVAPEFQGRGLATLLYRDLFDFARRAGVQRVTCELDREPPNENSARFHAKLGFREVGTLAHPGKLVSLQVADAETRDSGEGSN